MRAILYRYLIVIVACIALLTGLQVPSLVDQYAKRVDAHLREVSVNLQPFQDIADKYFNGDMGKLIALHRNSDARPFQAEGDAIEKMVQRKLRFEAELAALHASLPLRALHVLFNADSEMLDEVLAQYSYTVPLDADALMFGAASALFILLWVELLLALARSLLARTTRARAPDPKAR